ncbi:hypothetical protein TorRG33x02_318880, partial [Trema orientale]
MKNPVQIGGGICIQPLLLVLSRQIETLEKTLSSISLSAVKAYALRFNDEEEPRPSSIIESSCSSFDLEARVRGFKAAGVHDKK